MIPHNVDSLTKATHQQVGLQRKCLQTERVKHEAVGSTSSAGL
jgi:hypothetical protein